MSESAPVAVVDRIANCRCANSGNLYKMMETDKLESVSFFIMKEHKTPVMKIHL